MTATDLASDDAPTAVEMLLDSHHSPTGRSLTDTRARIALAQGLDRDVLHQIAALASHAVAINSAFARFAWRRDPSGPLHEIATFELFAVASRRVSDGFTRYANSKHNPRLGPPGREGPAALPQVLAWTEVIAVLPDPREMSDLYDQVFRSGPYWSGHFGDLAPLAYAAGLDRHEVEQRHHDGTLDEEALLTMAALRGITWWSR